MISPPDASLPPFERLIMLMRQLRDKENRCPWDIEQTSASIAPYALEEAYEVVDAIERNDMHDLKGELGDLLLQVVFHAEMASEAKHFTMDDVCHTLVEKMIARHPHVYASEGVRSAKEQQQAWEAQKSNERIAAGYHSALDNIPATFPAITRAHKLQKRAAALGFDWPDTQQVFDKVQEEIAELQEAIASKDAEHIEEELGDLLFVVTNIARKCDINADEALRKANRKFEQRFRHMEAQALRDHSSLQQESLTKMEARWQHAKQCLSA